MRGLFWILWLGAAPAAAQYAAPEAPPSAAAAAHPAAPASAPPAAASATADAAAPAASEAAASGLPPFLAKMQRHDVTVRVLRGAAPVGPGVPVRFHITAGGARVRDYDVSTGPDGTALFRGIPTNPEVQRQIGYTVSVEVDGVRFPFEVDRVPTDGGQIEVAVPELTTDTSSLRLTHGMVELFADEESLVVQQELRLHNDGEKAVDLSKLPGGGLVLPMPAGAKHPELHESEEEGPVEVRGTDLVYTGALPARSSAPIQVFFTVPYGPRTFEWSQAMPIAATGGMVVVGRDKRPQQQAAVALELEPLDGTSTVSDSELPGGKRFQVLRAEGVKLAPGQPLRFAIRGLPPRHGVGLYVLLAVSILVVAGIVLGFRRSEGGDERLSRAHLENERDRLLKALARMRKAVARGQMTEVRFEREREAITARLVSLYRALDRLDAR